MSETIPIIDLQQFGLHVADSDSVDDSVVEKIAEGLYTAFSTIGFCYIVNHGIPQTLIDDVFSSSRSFFCKQPKDKERYVRDHDNFGFGWDSLGSEILDPEGPLRDYKESYNFLPFVHKEGWTEDMKNFNSTLGEMFDKCSQLTHRLLRVLSVALNIQDVDYLRQCHDKIGVDIGNTSQLRTLYYPEIPSTGRCEQGLIRCGEHSDYGTMSLLFQDNAGGLQVQNTSGEFVAATPIPGSLLVNIGDVMQRWTDDRLKATRHRVVIPETEIKKKQSRQSFVFFVNPNNDTIVKSLDGSNKFSSFRFEEYILDKFKITIKTKD